MIDARTVTQVHLRTVIERIIQGIVSKYKFIARIS